MSADTCAISSVVNTLVRWRKPASPRKWPVRPGRRRPLNERCEVERAAVTVGECDVTRGVHGAGIDQRAEDDPPVEEVVDVTDRHVERSGREERHRRPPVVDDVGDLVHVEAHRGVPTVAGGAPGRHRRRPTTSRCLPGVSIVNGRPRRARARPGRPAQSRSAARRGNWVSKKSATSIVSTSTSLRVRKSIVMTDQASEGVAWARDQPGRETTVAFDGTPLIVGTDSRSASVITWSTEG